MNREVTRRRPQPDAGRIPQPAEVSLREVRTSTRSSPLWHELVSVLGIGEIATAATMVATGVSETATASVEISSNIVGLDHEARRTAEGAVVDAAGDLARRIDEQRSRRRDHADDPAHHDEQAQIGVLIDFVNRGDVRVIQRGQHLGFAHPEGRPVTPTLHHIAGLIKVLTVYAVIQIAYVLGGKTIPDHINLNLVLVLIRMNEDLASSYFFLRFDFSASRFSEYAIATACLTGFPALTSAFTFS